MTSGSLSVWCRLLAVGAWAASLGWFYLALVASWGFVPGAMLLWSVLALPLAILTSRWLARVGAPIPTPVRLWTKRLWVALVLVQVLFYALFVLPLWDEPLAEAILSAIWIPMAVPYALFPLALTSLAIYRAVTARPPQCRAPAV